MSIPPVGGGAPMPYGSGAPSLYSLNNELSQMKNSLEQGKSVSQPTVVQFANDAAAFLKGNPNAQTEFPQFTQTVEEFNAYISGEGPVPTATKNPIFDLYENGQNTMTG